MAGDATIASACSYAGSLVLQARRALDIRSCHFSSFSIFVHFTGILILSFSLSSTLKQP